MSRSPWSVSRRANGTGRPISELVERAAKALRAEDYRAVGREAERMLVVAGQQGQESAVRQAGLLLAAADREDAAATVEALVRLAQTLDSGRRAA